MSTGRWPTILRILKPLAAGLALAYLVTAFVDKPAPVHFQPENPYASKQAEIVEPQAEKVMEKNIMKLGSPLSVQPDEVIKTESVGEVLQVPADQIVATDNATSSIKSEVENITEP